MRLEEVFPDCDVYRDPSAIEAGRWEELFRLPLPQALQRINELLELPSSSTTAKAIVGSTDIGLLLPKRASVRRRPGTKRLAVQYGARHVMLFHSPREDRLICGLSLNESYLSVVAKLGAWQFSQTSGRLVWPSVIESLVTRLSAQQPHNLLPFFDHGTGDYDCWANDDLDVAWYFDHETESVTDLGTRGFGAWCDRRFADQLMASSGL